jgi:hypothetical protein
LSESVLETSSDGGIPCEKSSGLAMSTSIFPARFSPPADSRNAIEPAPLLALTTSSARAAGDSVCLPYVAVSDVAEALERVEALGGSVVLAGEAWLTCKDSAGSPFGLAQESLEGFGRSPPPQPRAVAAYSHVDAPGSERAAVAASLLAPVVLERDTEPDAKIHDGAVLDRQVLAHDLGHAELAHTLRSSLNRNAGRSLPRLAADTDDLGDTVDAIRHANLLVQRSVSLLYL